MGIGVMVKETGVFHKDLSVCQSLIKFTTSGTSPIHFTLSWMGTNRHSLTLCKFVVVIVW